MPQSKLVDRPYIPRPRQFVLSFMIGLAHAARRGEAKHMCTPIIDACLAELITWCGSRA